MNHQGKHIPLSVTSPGGECEHSCDDSLVSVHPVILYKIMNVGVPEKQQGTVGTLRRKLKAVTMVSHHRDSEVTFFFKLEEHSVMTTVSTLRKVEGST